MKQPIPQSNQYPNLVKKQPVSYTLQYKGLNIQGAMNCRYIFCKNKADELSRGGLYQRNIFVIKPNF